MAHRQRERHLQEPQRHSGPNSCRQLSVLSTAQGLTPVHLFDTRVERPHYAHRRKRPVCPRFPTDFPQRAAEMVGRRVMIELV